MRSRNQFGALLAAGLLGLAAIAIAPRLYGGGGDEGGDILPGFGPGPTGDGGAAAPRRFIAVHGSGNGVVLDTVDHPMLSGFTARPHTKGDVFVGLPSEEPFGGDTTLEILVKGRLPRLDYSDVVSRGRARIPSYVHMTGRFEVKDFDPTDDEKLEIVGYRRRPGIQGFVLGYRKSREGGIWQSFEVVDHYSTDKAPTGIIDLGAMREAVREAFSGSGYDAAVVLYTTTPRGVDEVWAAWSVDDKKALYDIEVRFR